MSKTHLTRPPIVAVLGHIDHGKCITENTAIPLADGRVLEAKEIYNLYVKNNSFTRRKRNGFVTKIINGPEVFSFDEERIIRKKISHLWKLKSPSQLIRIKLASGDEITTTLEHPFFVFTFEGKIEQKQAAKISKDDFIIVPKNLHFTSSLSTVKQELLNKIAELKNFVVFLNFSKSKPFLNKLKRDNLQELRRRGLATTDLTTCILNKRFRAKDFVSLARHYKFSDQEIYQMIAFIKNATSLWRAGHTSNRMRLPQTREEFRKMGYLIGCLVGDGCIVDGLLHNNDKEVIETYTKYMKDVLGLSAKTLQGRTCKKTRTTGGKTLVRFLTDILNLPAKKKSANVEVPSTIAFYRPALVSFIEGWFDTDGYISHLNHSIEFTSKSSRLVKQVGIYLLQFGIHSVVFQKGGFYYLRVANDPYLRRFSEVFAPRIRRKRERIKAATKRSSTSRIFDMTPLSGKRLLINISYSNRKFPFFNQYKSYENLSRPFLQKLACLNDLDLDQKDLKAICNTDVSCVRVRSVKLVKSDDKFVYDFTIPETHNFIAERIIVHNTTLLDKIRRTNVVATEAGGITQHIGAYQVRVPAKGWSASGGKERESKRVKKITFIDTPGHAAFSQMRSRGAKVADLVVLVVAADEGFKPQTKESLKHIEEAKVPYLVAINKIDLLNVNVNKVKKDLAKNGILVEGEGGEIVTVPVSAKTGQGVDELLEMILLLAEMAELKADPQAKLEAVVIESKLDRARGALATVLVRNGCLKVKDEIKVDNIQAKIRAMFDENGKRVDVAGPSKPVEILGFEELPPVGGVVGRTNGKLATLKTQKKREEIIETTEDTEKKLKIILKSDVAGTLEAILAALPKNVEIIFSQVGDVTESDILLASATGAEIIGFRVKASSGVQKLAQVEKVEIKIFQVIYELLEEIEERVLKMIEPTIDEEVLGLAEIIAEFEVKKQRIAGCKVYEGRIDKKDQLHLKRENKIIGDCRIKSMKRGKENINQAKKGDEFGVIFKPLLDFKIGDVLVSYRQKEQEG